MSLLSYICSSSRTDGLIIRSTGNEAIDTLAFLHLLEQLKVSLRLEAAILIEQVQKRSGWIREGVSSFVPVHWPNQ